MRSSRWRRRRSSTDAGSGSRGRLTWMGIPFSRPAASWLSASLSHQRRQIDDLDLDLAPARFEGREIQDVVDQRQHRLTAAADHLDVLALLHRQRPGVPLDEQLAERDQRAERAAEIVAHPQEEQIARQVGAVAVCCAPPSCAAERGRPRPRGMGRASSCARPGHARPAARLTSTSTMTAVPGSSAAIQIAARADADIEEGSRVGDPPPGCAHGKRLRQPAPHRSGNASVKVVRHVDRGGAPAERLEAIGLDRHDAVLVLDHPFDHQRAHAEDDLRGAARSARG